MDFFRHISWFLESKLVLGGRLQVDLMKRHCFPVYWHGENRRVLRGHWFARKGGLDWLPLREDIAEQLELAYRCQVGIRELCGSVFILASSMQASSDGSV